MDMQSNMSVEGFARQKERYGTFDTIVDTLHSTGRGKVDGIAACMGTWLNAREHSASHSAPPHSEGAGLGGMSTGTTNTSL